LTIRHVVCSNALTNPFSYQFFAEHLHNGVLFKYENKPLKKKIVWPTHLASICDCSVSAICCLLFLSVFFIYLDGCYLWAALLPLPIFSVLSRKWHFQIRRISQADLIRSLL